MRRRLLSVARDTITRGVTTVSIPSAKECIFPLLRYLVRHPHGATKAEATSDLADEFGLTGSERTEVVDNGNQVAYEQRIAKAQTRLNQAGLASFPQLGHWRATEEGITLLNARPE